MFIAVSPKRLVSSGCAVAGRPRLARALRVCVVFFLCARARAAPVPVCSCSAAPRSVLTPAGAGRDPFSYFAALAHGSVCTHRRGSPTRRTRRAREHRRCVRQPTHTRGRRRPDHSPPAMTDRADVCASLKIAVCVTVLTAPGFISHACSPPLLSFRTHQNKQTISFSRMKRCPWGTPGACMDCLRVVSACGGVATMDEPPSPHDHCDWAAPCVRAWKARPRPRVQWRRDVVAHHALQPRAHVHQKQYWKHASACHTQLTGGGGRGRRGQLAQRHERGFRARPHMCGQRSRRVRVSAHATAGAHRNEEKGAAGSKQQMKERGVKELELWSTAIKCHSGAGEQNKKHMNAPSQENHTHARPGRPLL